MTVGFAGTDAKALLFVDAIGHPDGLEVLREPVRVTHWRPDIAGLLPVYVADRYEGVEARPFPELDDAELERYLERNVAAVREVVARARPDVALANHLVMGPVILARALGERRAVRGEDPRQRAGVLVKRDPALPALRPRGARGRARRARRLAPHGREPVGGDGRPRAAGAHPPRPAGRRRGAVPPPTPRRAAAPRARCAGELGARAAAARRRSAFAATRARPRRALANARARERPARRLRRQADRLQGRRAARGGLAARARAACRRRGS